LPYDDFFEKSELYTTRVLFMLKIYRGLWLFEPVCWCALVTLSPQLTLEVILLWLFSACLLVCFVDPDPDQPYDVFFEILELASTFDVYVKKLRA
jgi:hypothetical protein